MLNLLPLAIVPENEKLALEVQIYPQVIDKVMLDQKAVLCMSAFNQRTTLGLNGRDSRPHRGRYHA